MYDSEISLNSLNWEGGKGRVEGGGNGGRGGGGQSATTSSTEPLKTPGLPYVVTLVPTKIISIIVSTYH